MTSMTRGPRSAASLYDPDILWPALGQSVRKLDPRLLWRNPVMFVVEIVSVLTTILLIRDALAGRPGLGFALQINIWLWFTVLFANFAEAVAEGRGRAQAATLRRARTETLAKRLLPGASGRYERTGLFELVAPPNCEEGDIVLVEAGDIIPSDGEVIEGVASVERGGDHRRVRTGDPRKRRRPLGGYRRHAGAVGLDLGCASPPLPATLSSTA